MKKMGFSITTAEGHFLTRCELIREGQGIYLDTSFEKDVVKSVTVPKLKQLAEIKQKLEAAHPEVKLWAVELFKDQGRAFCRSATNDAPPWFKTQHERFSRLYSVQ
ncbi:hypothetical protein CWO84_04780 [Methylomonas sp. Kb3]|uniref:hypothetical protein n=1 Tax=Methylomonas sp. Kb3 TaxID=1611544 RepID=UPI000C31CF5C|nr:hypothetical protein [Methylomonas sp. Kb3]PKD41450.1 hypothetical protein CWO84_04780 [Methylomonas sp. Kb3]